MYFLIPFGTYQRYQGDDQLCPYLTVPRFCSTAPKRQSLKSFLWMGWISPESLQETQLHLDFWKLVMPKCWKLSFFSPWLCFLVPRGCSSFCLPSSPRLWGEFIESYRSWSEWVRPWMSMAFSAWMMRKAEAQGNPETKLVDSIERWKLQLHRCSKNDACWSCCKHVLGFFLNTLTRLWVIFVPSKTQCLSERSHKS